MPESLAATFRGLVIGPLGRGAGTLPSCFRRVATRGDVNFSMYSACTVPSHWPCAGSPTFGCCQFREGSLRTVRRALLIKLALGRHAEFKEEHPAAVELLSAPAVDA